MSTPTRKSDVKAVLVAKTSTQTPMLDNAEVEAAADLDRILGDTLLFMLNEARPKLRVSMPTLYRAMRAGRIPYVWVGSRRAITPPGDEAPPARRDGPDLWIRPECGGKYGPSTCRRTDRESEWAHAQFELISGFRTDGAPCLVPIPPMHHAPP